MTGGQRTKNANILEVIWKRKLEGWVEEDWIANTNSWMTEPGGSRN